jgi:hypothetical protein
VVQHTLQKTDSEGQRAYVTSVGATADTMPLIRRRRSLTGFPVLKLTNMGSPYGQPLRR